MFATFYAIINYKVIWSVIPLIFVFTILYALRIQLQIVRKQYKLRINRPYFVCIFVSSNDFFKSHNILFLQNSLVVVYHLTFAVLWIMYIVYQLIYHVDDFKVIMLIFINLFSPRNRRTKIFFESYVTIIKEILHIIYTNTYEIMDIFS